MRSTSTRHPLPEAVGLAGALADDLARVLVIGVMVVGERGQGNQSFDEQVVEFDEQAELRHADDQAFEHVADARLHELYFLPFHQLALGVVGAAFGLAGFFGDVVQFVERDRAAGGLEGFLVSSDDRDVWTRAW